MSSSSWKWQRHQEDLARKQKRRARAKNLGLPDPDPDPPKAAKTEPEGQVKRIYGGALLPPTSYFQSTYNMGSYVRSFRLFANAFGLDDRKPPVDLPVREQVDPIVAYKRAAIVDGPLRLYGVGRHAPYKPDDTATCQRGCSWSLSPGQARDPKCSCAWCSSPEGHAAPEATCTCGFYAMDKTRLGQLGNEYHTGIADLQVELSGKVIRHRDGYRAQHQRVLGVFVDPACRCCRRAASVMATGPEGGYFYSLVSERRAPELRTFCLQCVPGKAKTYTPADLANEWGIEVTWGSIQ